MASEEKDSSANKIKSSLTSEEKERLFSEIKDSFTSELKDSLASKGENSLVSKEKDSVSSKEKDSVSSKEKRISTSREKESLRLLLLGATGAGKSITGNTIFLASDDVNGKVFVDGSAGSGHTEEVEEFTRNVLGRSVTIVDTPGVLNLDDGEHKIIPEIKSAIEKASESFDALLLIINVFKTGLSLDEHTQQAFAEITKKISKDFWKYAVIVFTYEDNYWQLHKKKRSFSRYEKIGVREFVGKSITSSRPNAVGQIANKVGNKAVVSIDNTEKDKDRIKEKVAEVFEAVDYVREKNKYKKFDKKKHLIKSGCPVM